MNLNEKNVKYGFPCLRGIRPGSPFCLPQSKDTRVRLSGDFTL